MTSKRVVSIVETETEYRDGKAWYYGLEKNKPYRVAEKEEIPLSPNSDQFIHIIQFDGAVIPYNKDNFITIEEWREKQIDRLLLPKSCSDP